MKAAFFTLSLIAGTALAAPTSPDYVKNATAEINIPGGNQTFDGTLDLITDDSTGVGNLQSGCDDEDTDDCVFNGTMNIGDDEALVHGPMYNLGDEESGVFQGDLTVVGDAGVVQGDAGVGGEPVLRLGAGGDEGLRVGVGNVDLIGGAATTGVATISTWNQDLTAYRATRTGTYVAEPTS